MPAPSNANVTIISICLALLGSSYVFAQRPSTSASQLQIEQTVTRLFEQNLKAGTSAVAPGVCAYTRVPFPESAVDEIRSFGQDALPVLAGELKSPKIRFRELAVLCIGSIGGEDALHLLEATTLSSRSQSLRLQALEWVGSFPGQAAASSLKRIETRSTDHAVQTRAKELLLKRSQGN